MAREYLESQYATAPEGERESIAALGRDLLARLAADRDAENWIARDRLERVELTAHLLQSDPALWERSRPIPSLRAELETLVEPGEASRAEGRAPDLALGAS